MKFNKATEKQTIAARKFAEKYNTTVSQAMKYLDECFKHSRGEMTDAQMYEITRWPSLKPQSKVEDLKAAQSSKPVIIVSVDLVTFLRNFNWTRSA